MVVYYLDICYNTVMSERIVPSPDLESVDRRARWTGGLLGLALLASSFGGCSSELEQIGEVQSSLEVEAQPLDNTEAELPLSGISSPHLAQSETKVELPRRSEGRDFSLTVDSIVQRNFEIVSSDDSSAYFTGRYADSNVHVAVVDLKGDGVEFRVSSGNDLATVTETAEKYAATYAVNGNYFLPYAGGDEEGFVGHSISQGYVMGVEHPHANAVFGVDQHGRPVFQRLGGGQELDGSIQYGVNGRLFVIEDGSVDTDGLPGEPAKGTSLMNGPLYTDATINIKDPRTMIGVDEYGSVYMAVVEGRRSDESEGATGQEMAGLGLALGLENAILVDGGGSSSLYVKGEPATNRPADPGGRERQVRNVAIVRILNGAEGKPN